MADKKEVNQAKLQALTSGAKKKSPFQKQLEQIEAKKKVPHPNPLSIARLLIIVLLTPGTLLSSRRMEDSSD